VTEDGGTVEFQGRHEVRTRENIAAQVEISLPPPDQGSYVATAVLQISSESRHSEFVLASAVLRGTLFD
jgi:hypothetical protein